MAEMSGGGPGRDPGDLGWQALAMGAAHSTAALCPARRRRCLIWLLPLTHCRDGRRSSRSRSRERRRSHSRSRSRDREHGRHRSSRHSSRSRSRSRGRGRPPPRRSRSRSRDRARYRSRSHERRRGHEGSGPRGQSPTRWQHGGLPLGPPLLLLGARCSCASADATPEASAGSSSCPSLLPPPPPPHPITQRRPLPLLLPPRRAHPRGGGAPERAAPRPRLGPRARRRAALGPHRRLRLGAHGCAAAGGAAVAWVRRRRHCGRLLVRLALPPLPHSPLRHTRPSSALPLPSTPHPPPLQRA